MNVVVTGGGTIAPIDDVRSITNVSSGRFSAMISEAWLRLGADVWHIHAPSALLPYQRSARFDLETPDPEAEMARLERLRDEYQGVRSRLHRVPLRVGTVAEYANTLRHVLQTQSIDVAMLAMAVSDFEPEPFLGKIDSDAETLLIQGRHVPKVIRSVRDWAPNVYLVGFKLLSGVSQAELMREAEDACLVNRADATVANDLQTLRAGQHTVHVVRPGQAPETLGPGDDLGDRLVDRLARWIKAEGREPATPEPSGL
ncbi:phosphopantothenoylcysteine decarboxylase [Singulisphaera sp. PoT]|uniref:phosphopantothenoylcysteine decarboxylase domain-containing protein n=1 Tax=Singulisphaera sp. PoT TaxID=3411797 RepID=UPI003BF55816